MLRAAIVRFGKTVNGRASKTHKITGGKTVGVCDREPSMANRLYDRLPARPYISCGNSSVKASRTLCTSRCRRRAILTSSRSVWNRDVMFTWKSHSHFTRTRSELS